MLVAVVAHSGKTLGGGLEELRAALGQNGYPNPLWYEVKKSSKAPKAVRRAIEKGAELLFVWGGDGMVQRCADAMRGSKVPIAILPAGTGNLLATDLGIPKDIKQAVDIGLHGARRKLDLGVINGERFAAMAGTGFDAIIMHATTSAEKEQLGRAAYLRSSVKAMRAHTVRMRVRVDQKVWFKGEASCLLVGNIGRVTGGVEIFRDASPWDGKLEVGVVTAKNAWEWLKIFTEVAVGRTDQSHWIEKSSGTRIDVKLRQRKRYELDGGPRPRAKRLRIRVDPGAITVCVPAAAP